MASSFRKNQKIAVAVIILLLVTAVVLFAQKFTDSSFLGIGGGKSKTKGPASAKIEIVEYSDFQCPACQRALPVLNKFFEDYPNKIKLVYRHFPLSGHRWAKLTHQAAECSARQGKFWEYHDRLYAGQEKWSVMEDPMPVMIQYAEETGLQMERFGACLSDESITRDILNEKEEGLKQQIRSTPTFFINGQRFVGAMELQRGGELLIRETLGIKDNQTVP